MKIAIVAHCWAERFPHYAHALGYQLSSFILNAPKQCTVEPWVCYYGGDHLTRECLTYYARQDGAPEIHALALSMPALGRRCIGRNLAALQTDADLVWFTDADWVFGPGCLDALANWAWPTDCTIAYPPDSLVSVDHATGDVATGRMADWFKVMPVDTTEMVGKVYNRAIGPIQIVRGEYARKYGYLNGHPIANERTDGNYFGDFRDDIVFRNECTKYGKQHKVHLPHLYRLRHSTTTYQ